MFKDLPQMGQCVRVGDPIYDWVVLFFAGQERQRAVYWTAKRSRDSAVPAISSSCFFGMMHDGNSLSIGVDPSNRETGEVLNCEQAWHEFVLGVMGLKFLPEYRQVKEQSLSGKLNGKEWFLAMITLEYAAIRKAKDFYEFLWMPQARKMGLTTDMDLWWRREWASFDGWLLYRWQRGDFEPRYMLWYDEHIRPFIGQRAQGRSGNDSGGLDPSWRSGRSGARSDLEEIAAQGGWEFNKESVEGILRRWMRTDSARMRLVYVTVIQELGCAVKVWRPELAGFLENERDPEVRRALETTISLLDDCE